MSVGERDPYSGHMTTGHDWNGIKELNTPVPRIIFLFLGGAFLFAVGYWIMMPAWPTGDDYTRGKLGFKQSEVLFQEIEQATLSRSEWSERLENMPFDQIQVDPQLMGVVNDSGTALFRDNCAGCHGAQGQGAAGYPRLSDSDWLWGDDPDLIARTLEVGINANHPETRNALMLAFGANGILDAQQVTSVATYVRSLTDPTIGNGSRVEELLSVTEGSKVYAQNCIGCHGADGGGNQALGAPRLNDQTWLYGGDQDAVYDTIWKGRQGHMPAWSERLSVIERRILSLHVLSLGRSSEAPGERFR